MPWVELSVSHANRWWAMPLGLIGRKVGMTQVYDDQGQIAPVTVLQIGPCPVLMVRNQERDGYDAVQLGYQDKSRRQANRAERGHVAGDLESRRKKARQAAGVALPPHPNSGPAVTATSASPSVTSTWSASTAASTSCSSVARSPASTGRSSWSGRPIRSDRC